jgi:hypothetical protein
MRRFTGGERPSGKAGVMFDAIIAGIFVLAYVYLTMLLSLIRTG